MAKLLSINNYHYYRGGAETVFLEHNRLFAELGWDVAVFAMQHRRNLPSEWSRYFVDEIEFGEEYTLWQRIARVPKVIYSMEAVRKLSRLIDEAQPDICHAHNIYHHISPSILSLLRRRSIPVVLTLHDLKIACPAYNMLAPDGVCERCRGGRVHNVLARRCIKGSVALSGLAFAESVVHAALGTYRRCVNRFAVPSRFYIDKLCEWGWPRSSFTHVPNFVDSARFVPQFSPGRYFVYVGRVSREKGLATLIRAAAAAGAELVILGTGALVDELQGLAAQLNAKVSFPGHLRGEALHDRVRGARAVVLPSEWYENAPMSVLEAYALGKPVLGARIGGIPELVLEQQTGLTFPSGDAKALAAALQSFNSLQDAEVEAMGRRARQWVESEFSIDRYRDRILSVYREIGVPVREGAGPQLVS